MDKTDVKIFLEKTEKMVKKFGIKAGDLAKIIEKDATYGTKVGMIKIEQLSLENEKNKILGQLGKAAYGLLKKKEISHKKLAVLFKKIKDIETKIRIKSGALTGLKKKFQQKPAAK